MSLKYFKISAFDASKGLLLGEIKIENAEEKNQSKVYGACGYGMHCSGGGGQCGYSDFQK